MDQAFPPKPYTCSSILVHQARDVQNQVIGELGSPICRTIKCNTKIAPCSRELAKSLVKASRSVLKDDTKILTRNRMNLFSFLSFFLFLKASFVDPSSLLEPCSNEI